MLTALFKYLLSIFVFTITFSFSVLKYIKKANHVHFYVEHSA